MVPEGVVDILEAIQVHQHHGNLVTGSLRGIQRMRGPVLEQRTVREPGQAVVQRLVPVQVALGLQAPLRTGQRHAGHGDEHHGGEQGRDIEGQHETIGESHPRGLLHGDHLMSRGGQGDLGLERKEDGVDLLTANGDDRRRGLVTVHGVEHFACGTKVRGVFAADLGDEAVDHVESPRSRTWSSAWPTCFCAA